MEPNQENEEESEEDSGDEQEGELFWWCGYCDNEYTGLEREEIIEEQQAEYEKCFESTESPKFQIIS